MAMATVMAMAMATVMDNQRNRKTEICTNRFGKEYLTSRSASPY